MSQRNLIILEAVGVVLLILWFAVSRKVRHISRAMFGTDDPVEGIRSAKEQAALTRPSLSSMTRLMLPLIEKDFPGFSWPQMKVRAENTVRSVLAAIDGRDLSLLSQGDAGGQLLKTVSQLIDDDVRSGINEHFEQVEIHDTVISGYEKRNGLCVVRLQSGVGYDTYRTGEGTETEQDHTPHHVETRYNSELVYVQDVSKAPPEMQASGLHCPNCGAPVKTLGQKHCDYCGAALEEISTRVWSLESVRVDERI